MPLALPLVLSVFRDSHDRWGAQRQTTWASISAGLTHHVIGEKDGTALACATFTGARGNATVHERSLVALDIETSRATGEVPPTPAQAAAVLRGKRLAGVLWTTFNHLPEAPRYRILMPLSRPLNVPELGEADPFISACTAVRLGLYGVCDPSKFGAASLMFLPRVRDGDAPREAYAIDGAAIDADLLRNEAILNAENEAMAEAERLALRRSVELPAAIMNAINAFNDAHDIVDLFEKYGYVRDGRGRWKSIYQHGQGATCIMHRDAGEADVWVSFSDSDASAGVGNRPGKASSQCACWGDAFSLFLHYEHRGNFRAAVAAAQSMADDNAALI
jgi:hypothetical protein